MEALCLLCCGVILSVWELVSPFFSDLYRSAWWSMGLGLGLPVGFWGLFYFVIYVREWYVFWVLGVSN